jgi:hypothetical protein
MSLRTAIILLFSGASVVLLAALYGLAALHASDEVVVLAYIAVLIASSFASSLIVMRWGDKPPHR